MKISIFIGVLLGSLACFGAEKTRLKMGVEEIPYLPYFEYAQSQYNGFAKDLLDSFAKDSDLEWVYTGYPVKRLYNNYLKKNSSLDFKFPDHENWQEELKEGHKIFYSRGVISFTDGVMVQKRNLGKVKLKTLGIVRGFTPFDFLPQIRSGQVKVIEANRIEGLLIQAAKGRVDGVYVNIEVAKYL
ncbi:MAG: ABC transporter substrate-binding protein, partial [Bdellovibrionales bacterium]|nr:ABC transporter substrate-binding protein [Bdellovibrionales bacterium]